MQCVTLKIFCGTLPMASRRRTLVLTTSLSAESGCSSRRASSEQFAFHVYVGFDPGDPFYDVSTNRAAVMEYFKVRGKPKNVPLLVC